MVSAHLTARIGVYAFIIKDKKLFYLHKPNDPIWTVVGGKIEENDTSIEETIYREVQEEIGVEIKLGEIFAVKIWSPDYKEKRLGVFYIAEFKNPKATVKLSNEHDDYKFLTYNQAKEMLSQEPRGQVGIELINALKRKNFIE